MNAEKLLPQQIKSKDRWKKKKREETGKYNRLK